MLEGTLKAKEETALKAYFKQQGLSEEEMQQAITAFKQQKAQKPARCICPSGSAYECADTAFPGSGSGSAGSNRKRSHYDGRVSWHGCQNIPYVLKMADLSKVVGQDGKINEETMKSALNQVLEDVPALKPQAKGSSGFVQVGAAGGKPPQGSDGPISLKDAVSEALKK